MTTKQRDLNVAVLEALGINWKDQDIISVKVELAGPAHVPTATITRALFQSLPCTRRFKWSGETVVTTSKLLSAEPRRFDLEAMCEAAKQEIKKTIEKAYLRETQAVRSAFASAAFHLCFDGSREILDQWLRRATGKGSSS